MSTTQSHAVRPVAAERDPRRPNSTAIDGPLRLTRRGRIVVVVAALLVVFGGFVVFGPSVIATDEAGPEPEVVTVKPGETLWDIAGRVDPDRDVRDTVAEITELNDISDAGTLRVGAEIAVPRQ